MTCWLGKVAVVTGAAHGLGAAIASRLVREGLIVVGLDLVPEPIKERAKQFSAEKGRLHAFKTDITKEKEVKEAFKNISEQLGPMHILCNNAVSGIARSILETNAQVWQKALNINVLGVCIATKEAVKIMTENHIKGHIINMNSVQGHKVTNFNLNVYPATKFAVRALNETLRQELRSLKSKIKVTSISLSLVDSQTTTWYHKLPAETQKMYEQIPKLTLEDVTDGVMYVLSTPEHVQVKNIIFNNNFNFTQNV